MARDGAPGSRALRLVPRTQEEDARSKQFLEGLEAMMLPPPHHHMQAPVTMGKSTSAGGRGLPGQ